MGHHDVLACVANGTSVILCEHSNTERGYLVELQTRLDSLLNKDPNFKKIDIVISKTDRDPLEIV